MKTYISCPYSIPLENLERAHKELSAKYTNVNFKYHNRNAKLYSDKPIRECDIFAIMLPDNKFEYDIHALPSGCFKEILLARSLNKKITVIYLRQFDTKYHMYNLDPEYKNKIKGLYGEITIDDLNSKKFVNTINVKESDLTGQLEEIPLEIAQKVIDISLEQGCPNPLECLSFSLTNGFDFAETKEGHDFWYNVLIAKRYDLFYKEYPTIHSKSLGDIASIPSEIVVAMLNAQEKQGNLRNINIFKRNRFADFSEEGFNWDDTIEGLSFWAEILEDEKYSIFFDKYPKKSITDYSEKIQQSPLLTEKDWIERDEFVKTFNKTYDKEQSVSNNMLLLLSRKRRLK